MYKVKIMKDKKSNFIEIRESLSVIESEDNAHKIKGFIPYNVRSYNLGGFVEIIAPSAFSKTLADNSDVKLLYSHDSNKVLARVKNGSLILRNTESGLEFEATLNNTSFALDAYEQVKSNTVDALSFGFQVIQDDWATEGVTQIRTLKEVKLLEVSAIVAFPAYPFTSSEVRGIELNKLETILSKDKIDEIDYDYLSNVVDNLRSLIPAKEEKKEEVAITVADEKSLLADETRSFLTNLLAECKK
jgi:hypothetical protein